MGKLFGRETRMPNRNTIITVRRSFTVNDVGARL